MKTYFDIFAYNTKTHEERLLRTIEVDTEKTKAGLTPKQKAVFNQIVERLGLKGKELTDAQEESILYLALRGDTCPDEKEYLYSKRIEKSDAKGISLLIKVYQNLSDDALKSRLFNFMVYLLICQDFFLHYLGIDSIGYGYGSFSAVYSTYAQILGVSEDKVTSTIEELKKQGAIVEGRKLVCNADFPYVFDWKEDNEEIWNELKNGKFIDENGNCYEIKDEMVVDGVCFAPLPYAELYGNEYNEFLKHF